MVTFANRTSVGTLLTQILFVSSPRIFAVYSAGVQSSTLTCRMRIFVPQKLTALLKMLSSPMGDSFDENQFFLITVLGHPVVL
jgi:hypothetical protein